MLAAGFPPATLPPAPLDPLLAALMASAVQPGEVVLLETQTNADEGLVVTNARVIIVKGPSRRPDAQHSGRYFPLDSIARIKTAWWFGIHFLAIITPDTTREPTPFVKRWRCSFGVTFADTHLGNAVTEYLQALLNHLAQRRQLALLNAPLQPIVPTGGIAVAAGEEFYLEVPAVYYARHGYTEWAGGSQGMSFRVMRGVYYRLGGTRGRSVRRESIEADDRGQLLIGNERVLFVGARRTIAISRHQITAVKVFTDGLQIGVGSKPLVQFSTRDQTAGLLLRRVLGIP